MKRCLLRLVLVRIYTCMDCNSRYYGYLFSRREEGEREAGG